MRKTLWYIFAFVLCVDLIMGTLGNGFIALVNIMNWIKRRRISSVDQILTALAISRLSFMCSGVICILISALCPYLWMNSVMSIVMDIIWKVNNHFSIWIATCLSVFYFLKIANFSNSFFLYLKWRVKKVILVTLLISLIFLFSSIVIAEIYVHFWIEIYEENAFYTLRNLTQFSTTLLLTDLPTVVISTNSSKILLSTNSLFMFIPFTVSLTAFLLLVFSLWKHHRKMQLSVKKARDASTMAHVKALQTGFSFLVLYIIYLLWIVLGISSQELMKADLIILLDYFYGTVFPTSHSIVLILGDSKLRRAALSVLWWLRCRIPSANS